MTTPIEQFHLRHQQHLVAYLQAELDLAFTFLQCAGIQQDQVESWLERVRGSIEIVKSLSFRIEDRRSLLAIEDRAAEYEKAVSHLSQVFRLDRVAA